MKMNRILNIIMTAAVFAGMVSCNVAAPETENNLPSPEMTEDVLPGELLVRFDASVEGLLREAGLTKSASTRSGVQSVDEVLALLEGCTLACGYERSFLLSQYIGESQPDAHVKGSFGLNSTALISKRDLATACSTVCVDSIFYYFSLLYICPNEKV